MWSNNTYISWNTLSYRGKYDIAIIERELKQQKRFKHYSRRQTCCNFSGTTCKNSWSERNHYKKDNYSNNLGAKDMEETIYVNIDDDTKESVVLEINVKRKEIREGIIMTGPYQEKSAHPTKIENTNA